MYCSLEESMDWALDVRRPATIVKAESGFFERAIIASRHEVLVRRWIGMCSSQPLRRALTTTEGITNWFGSRSGAEAEGRE